MQVIEVREVSRSKDGKRREVIVIGKGTGRRRRGATLSGGPAIDHGGDYPLRRQSVTVHQHVQADGKWPSSGLDIAA